MNFEIRIGGRLPVDAADLFGDLDVTRHGAVSVVRGEMDQAALHGLIDRIHILGLELITARKIRSSGI